MFSDVSDILLLSLALASCLMKELKEKLLPYALVVIKLVYSSTDHVNES